MAYEVEHDGYLISDDPERIDLDAIHAYLARSYWATDIPREIVARSVKNSLCLGVYTAGSAQVGLIRAVTDYATFAYLCDVYVLESHRRRGLAKAAMRAFMAHPRLQNLRRMHLLTQDAHGLYARHGFKVVEQPERHMEWRNLNLYQRLKQGRPSDEASA